MFQRIGADAFKGDLTNTWALCEALGNPHHQFKSIHIAGTNGKGSTSHGIAAVLMKAGYKTGLYTSPHLKEFTERIKINGLEVSKDFVVDFVERIKPVAEKIKPSFFEMTVAMAFDYFAKEKVDMAVIEVGLGGRLDSTNVITPVLSLITNISYDHQQLLGNKLKEIAFEKAGIIKPSTPVIISERQEEVETIFLQRAEKMKSKIVFASDHYQVSKTSLDTYQFSGVYNGTITSDLQGNYQTKNIAAIYALKEELCQLGFNIREEHFREAMTQVTSLTGLKGRWQQLNKSPLIIADTAHNEGGIRQVVEQLRNYKKALHIIFGMVNDKDSLPILSLLPREATYYFCQANIPRALNAEILRARAATLGLRGVAIPNVNQAIEQARKNTSPHDLIFVGGSTFVVAEIENL